MTTPPPKKPHNHQPHAQDDCQDCQAERRQNNSLVQFYQRISQMQGKMLRLRKQLTTSQQIQQQCKKGLSGIGSRLTKEPSQNIRLIEEHSSTEMGYQLASALIEREIKNRLENQRLQKIIQQLQRQKNVLETQRERSVVQTDRKSQQQPSTFFKSKSRSFQEKGQSRYSEAVDSIDQIQASEDSAYFRDKNTKTKKSNSYFKGDQANRKYWQDETVFSISTAPLSKQKAKNKPKEKNGFDGMNLWLYQYQPQEINENPIKALRKPVGKINNRAVNKSIM